jgi:hypothetical protein
MKTINENHTEGGIQDATSESMKVSVDVKKEDSTLSLGEALVVIVVMVAIGFGLYGAGCWFMDVVYRGYVLPVVSDDVQYTRHISPDVEFRSYTYRKDGYLVRTGSNDKLVDRVDWVQVGSDQDSLAVYSRKGKRGYFNRFTGKVAITPIYTRAWVFSQGRAAVVQNNRLKFIDHSGKEVIDHNLSIGCQAEDFIFHDGHCKVYDATSGKAGLVGLDGQWHLAPKCDDLYNHGKVWVFSQDGSYGLYHNDKGVVIPPVHTHVRVGDGQVMVLSSDNVVSRYDCEGRLLANMVIYEAGKLSYPKEKVAEYYSNIDVKYEMGVAECMYYKVDTDYNGIYWGLMDKQGRCITKPLYTYIEAIAPNRYLVWPQGTVLDSQGREVDSYDLP